MSKLIDYIIDEVRETADNEDFSDTVGLTEEEILKFLNDGAYRLHSKIIAQHASVFVDEKISTIVANQEAYTLPVNAHLSNRVTQVEYSFDSDTDSYFPLRPASLYNRRSGAKGDPNNYIRKSGSILLLPTPETTGGSLRISYTKKARRMDKRRGLVKAVTLDGSAITNLEINYVNGTTVDSTELGKRSYVTVVDQFGNIKMDNVLLSSIDASGSYDATLTSDSSHTYESGETIAVGDYVVSGAYTSTHPELGEEVERYLQAYAVWKVLKRDSSVDSGEAIQELAEIEGDILASYADLGDDIQEIPVINDDDSFNDWM